MVREVWGSREERWAGVSMPNASYDLDSWCDGAWQIGLPKD